MILPGPYYRVFPLLPLLPMMVQPLAALAVLQMPLLLLQLGQLNLCHLPKAETLLLHMQQQHILLQVHQKILRKALLFHVVKWYRFIIFSNHSLTSLNDKIVLIQRKLLLYQHHFFILHQFKTFFHKKQTHKKVLLQTFCI